jgi:hypothetical protein
MNIARLRSPFKDPKSRSSSFITARHRETVVLLLRGSAGGILISGIATASRLMYRLNWQTDGAIAALVAVGWVVWLELAMGGQ